MKSVYSPSSPKLLSRRDLLILAGAVLFVLAAYLAVSAYFYRIGFPLDDSWIHQTYARNLALRGEWAFVPGQPSGGSTAPLWTVLLAPGFWLGLSPYIWTYFLGGLLLFGLAVATELILRQRVSTYRPSYPWAGLLMIMEWHMAWAAFSGMETSLHILLMVLVFGMLLTGSRRYLVMGVLCGVSVWVRPDGLTLLGPLVLAVVLNESTLSTRISGLIRLGIGFLALLAPYLLFNLSVAGTPMPNTFYAKQAEYAVWQASPLSEKLLALLVQFFTGIAFVLLPAVLVKCFRLAKTKEWMFGVAIVWVLGYVAVYVSRLPVYQHGRYLMPAMAVFILLGFLAFFEINLKVVRNRRSALVRFSWISSLVMVILATFGFGVYTFGDDVAFIESQMVDAAHWVAENVPSGALIAAHDIGALGFFDSHPLLDLAGLISPEVVPFMNDDDQLSIYMDKTKVEYFVAFSGWKPALEARCIQIFTTGSEHLPRANLGAMSVYRWVQP